MHKHCKHNSPQVEILGPTFRRRGHRGRAGQALVEFAFILFIVVFLFGGALSLGYFFYSAQSLQTAVDVAAHEIARMPFAPDAELGLGNLAAPADAVMWNPRFRNEIYDERYLVVRLSQLLGGSLIDFAHREMPLLNRLLVSVMIFDPSYDPDDEGGVYRYPGAIVQNVRDPDDIYETVMIPVMAYDQFGQETLVRWVAPVEESDVGQFSVIPPDDSNEALAGVVALRINFPAQAPGLVNRSVREGAEGERETGPPMSGDDLLVVEEAPELSGGSNYELVVATNDGQFDSQGTPRIHAGRYGLGRQAAYYQELGVRPYRRIISVEAIYRREVFGAASDPEEP